MSGSGPLKVVVVDDSRLAHSRIVSLCEQLSTVQVVGQAFNGAEAIREVKRTLPDLVLMDVVMPDIDGMVALRMLCKGIPGIRVALVSSMGGSPRIGEEAFKLGAIAVLTKPVARETLEQLFAGELSRRGDDPGSESS